MPISVDTIQLGSRLIGPKNSTYIIAEAGVNHNGELATALALVAAAASAGADAVKFQTFKPEHLVTRALQKAPYQKINTGYGSQYYMLKQLELDECTHQRIYDHCNRLGITFLSTPFYEGGVDLLLSLGVSAIKVDSGNLTNTPLLRYIAAAGCPVILSTGMSSLGDIEDAVNLFRKFNTPLCLLHCTSNYPARLEDVHLNAMETMRRAFNCPVGYSDHTVGIGVSVAAVALGADVIEKHFTLDRNAEGPDHKASLSVNELGQMVREIRSVERALGGTEKRVSDDERSTVHALRRSIVADCPIARGTVITREMLAIKRPGDGIQPKYLELIVGRAARRDLKEDQLLSWDDV
ncbi:N-acetylneuraminate synthase [Magnetovirga frankeli]|uniref:N-acetylneuraminate synthase n=1 Tax=Magnetovirga frankeli TaxID=947516 RepID=UPI001292F027|nr:N-acetylneuraminate synthase [gamma proteobacterium SS-5]